MAALDNRFEHVDWNPIILSCVMIVLCLLLLYFQAVLELFNALKVAYAMAKGMTSNIDSCKHLLYGWPSYLLGFQHEYGFGSGSTALQVAMKNMQHLYNKTIIVTGGNSGIGLSLCTALAAVSHCQCEHLSNAATTGSNKDTANTACCIIMASRNKLKCQTAIKQILRKYPKADIRFMELNLGNLQSIVSFVDALKTLPSQVQENLTVLINNAGVAMLVEAESVKFDNTLDERMEKTFAVNYLGPFILTQLVYDNWFKRTEKECRIVNTSSLIHTVPSQLKEAELLAMDRITKYHLRTDYDHVIAYGISKLFNVVHTKMVMDEYARHNIVFNSCHPGTSVDTGLTAQHFGTCKAIINVASFVLRVVWKSNDQCAATSMLLACDPRIQQEKINGAYFEDCGIREESKYAKSKTIMENLKKYSFSVYERISTNK